MNRRQRRILKRKGLTEENLHNIFDAMYPRKQRIVRMLDLIDYKIAHDLDCMRDLIDLGKL